MPRSKVRQILEILVEKHVDFMIVGGVAAVPRGAPLNTLDLDIVQDLAVLPLLRRTLAESRRPQ